MVSGWPRADDGEAVRSASPALVALLNSGDDFEMADLWRIVLSGGQVVRWTDADIDIVSGGQKYVSGPLLRRGGVADRCGLESSTLEVTVEADENDTINSIPLIRFVSQRGLDGATVQLRRVFLPSWESPATGEILRFAGRVTSVGGIEGNSASITVSSWTMLLNVNYPPDLYQVPCLNSVYDVKCGLDPEDWEETGAVAVGTSTTRQFPTTLSLASGWLDQGTITFTGGANTGISRSVRTSAGDGTVTLVQALPAAPSVADTFVALPGCNLTRGVCETKFNNLLRHRGFPFVPTPETAI